MRLANQITTAQQATVWGSRTMVDLFLPLTAFPEPCPATPLEWEALFLDGQQTVKDEIWAMLVTSGDERATDSNTIVRPDPLPGSSYYFSFDGHRYRLDPDNHDCLGQQLGPIPAAVLTDYADQYIWFQRWATGSARAGLTETDWDALRDDDLLAQLDSTIDWAKTSYPRRPTTGHEIAIRCSVKPIHSQRFAYEVYQLAREHPEISYQIVQFDNPTA